MPKKPSKPNAVYEGETVEIPLAKLVYWLDLIDEGRDPAVLFNLDHLEMFKEAYIKRGETLDLLKANIRRAAFSGGDADDLKFLEDLD
jgi:hypothetical protein